MILLVVQIAGLVARRIVCESNKDQELKQGDRIGMIDLEVELMYIMKIMSHL